MNIESTIKYPKLQQISIYLASTLTVMAGAGISAAMNSLMMDFTTVANYQLVTRLVLSITSLAIAIGSIFSGWIVDKWGRKPLLIISLIIYAVTGTTGFYIVYFNLNPTATLYLILVGRALLGIAVAGIATSCTTLIADHYKDEKRNQVIGYQSSSISFGGAIFIVIGGALADIDWNFSFLIYFMSLVYLPLIYFTITEPNRIDNSSNDSEMKTVYKVQKIPIKNVLVSYFIVFVAMLVFYFIPPNFASYIHSFGEIKDVLVGIAIAMSSITSGISGLFYQILKKKIDYLFLFIIALTLLGVGFIITSYSSTYSLVIVGAIILGFGWGILMPNLYSWLVKDTPPILRGRIVGIYLTVLYFSQFISPIIAQPILNAKGFSFLFLIGGIVVLILSILPIVLLILKRIKSNIVTEQTQVTEVDDE